MESVCTRFGSDGNPGRAQTMRKLHSSGRAECPELRHASFSSILDAAWSTPRRRKPTIPSIRQPISGPAVSISHIARMGASRSSGERDRALEGGAIKEGGLTLVARPTFHAAFYIAFWIAMSSSAILFNKWILATAKFDFPLVLTTWHMTFATITTQVMAHYTSFLDSRHKVPMDFDTYKRAILPIGILFSLSLIFGNLAYLYLSVSFIQMLKASTAVVTLLTTWAFGIVPPNLKVLGNVAVIVLGVLIASFGEIKFNLLGFVYQSGGIVFEALRLVMVQRLLSSPEFKMDPLVSLYYYAPACAAINGALMLFVEAPRMSIGDIFSVGIPTLIANACVAFLLNVSTVLLIGKTSAVVLTMSGVLKDILLVMASMAIFRDPVTGQQFFGYSIALAGLMYYRLGAEKMKSLSRDAMLQLGEIRQKHPKKVKFMIVSTAVKLVIFFIIWTQTIGARSSSDDKSLTKLPGVEMI